MTRNLRGYTLKLGQPDRNWSPNLHYCSIVYYPGLHTNLMADAGNYILMTVYMTLSSFPFTVDRPFLRDTTPARRAGPGYLSKSCSP
jgi:hypothetical protein